MLWPYFDLSSRSFQIDFGDGAAQEGDAAEPQRSVVEEPAEEAGSQRGHQTRVHRAETQHRPAGEQKDEGGEEWVRRDCASIFSLTEALLFERKNI